MDKIAEAVLDRLLYIDELPSGPPPLIYHYTDFNGFRGIIESHSVWATYCRSLNDSTELQYGEHIVRKLLLDSIDDLVVQNQVAKTLDKLSDDLIPFVTCFCTKPNLLSMWREYAYRGGGYCLGFGSNGLH